MSRSSSARMAFAIAMMIVAAGCKDDDDGGSDAGQMDAPIDVAERAPDARDAHHETSDAGHDAEAPTIDAATDAHEAFDASDAASDTGHDADDAGAHDASQEADDAGHADATHPGDAGSDATVAPMVTSIAVTGAAEYLRYLCTEQLAAIATYANGTTGDVTSAAEWSSSVPSDVSLYAPGDIDANGNKLDYAQGVGVVISASFGGSSGSADVFLNVEGSVTVAVTPATTGALAVGASQPLVGTLDNGDGTTCVATPNLHWTTSNASVATVSAAGIVTGVAAGTVTITAETGTIAGTASVTVN